MTGVLCTVYGAQVYLKIHWMTPPPQPLKKKVRSFVATVLVGSLTALFSALQNRKLQEKLVHQQEYFDDIENKAAARVGIEMAIPVDRRFSSVMWNWNFF